MKYFTKIFIENTTIRAIVLLTVSTFLSSCKSSNEFNPNLIPVMSGKKFGYVDHHGKYVINPQFDMATFFRNDIAAVQINDLWGYIDIKGNYIINPIYKSGTAFSEGIAFVVKEGAAPMAINGNGDELFTIYDANAIVVFSEGLARFSVFKQSSGNARELIGFIDTKGNVVIDNIYSYAGDFRNGVAAVGNDQSKYGYINKNGDVVIDFQFDSASDFVDEYAVVSLSGQHGIIDKSGKFVINPQFDRLFSDGDTFIFSNGSMYGRCDKKGNIIINPQFEILGTFRGNDISPIKVGEEYGFVNEKGLIVISPQFKDVTYFFDDIAFAKLNDRWGIINKKGEMIVNEQFNSIGIDPQLGVVSDFFDIESIKNIVKGLVSEQKIDGTLDFSTPLSQIIEKYTLNESIFTPNNETGYHLKEILCKDAIISFTMQGNFHDKVSDGWFDYTNELNKSKSPSYFLINISLRNQGSSRSEYALNEIIKIFGNNQHQDDMRFKYGNFELSVNRDYDRILIKINGF